jgi:hypothetical protein
MSLFSVTPALLICNDAAGMELSDDAAAREFAAKVMSGLVWQPEDNWAGWTMEVWQGGRRVWHLPFVR